jgi:hypothetical protein
MLSFIQDWKIKWDKQNDTVGEINNKARGLKICPN